VRMNGQVCNNVPWVKVLGKKQGIPTNFSLMVPRDTNRRGNEKERAHPTETAHSQGGKERGGTNTPETKS